ncbi:uncharacterized protein LOC132554321 [Ylistrum balloti]|uniref:uncharacterized protein LOC132554321 n=1 Tax=Ylistrum balloti TaxID=509963 RepID=UPI0029058C3B|nr:uncharacterized protein LOC132554321 [Ylistrum balloti]
MLGRMYMETKTSEDFKATIATEDVIILSGVLGSGKTEVATQYGYEFHKTNPTSIVWMMRSKDQASLQMSMTTLANKLGILHGKDKDGVKLLEDIITNAIVGRNTHTSHVIIFDDVREVCQGTVKEIIKKLVPSAKPQVSIKIIVTTMDKLLKLPRAKRIQVRGFTEEEAINFLSGNQTCTDKDALKTLSKRMSYLPLGLSCAKTYMLNCAKSGRAFLKLLNANTLDKLDSKLAQLEESNRSLYSDLDTLIRIMEKELDEDAIEMFRMTQFLENENIPVVLFELLFPYSESSCEDADKKFEQDDFATCNSLSIDSLVQTVQKFSMGTIQGIDDKRTLTTHTAVSFTLEAYTDEETKRRLLKKLLWPFALILDKNNRNPDDYSRIVSILPHARSVLLKAQTLLKEDLELCLLMTFINDLVAYTNNFEGLLKLEKYHSEQALEYCYKIMETTENTLNKEVYVEQCITHEEHRKFAKAKAALIDRKLTKIGDSNRGQIEQFIRHFILQKRRTCSDVQFLTANTENYEGEALTMQQYQTLCKKERAVPLTDLVDSFITEMILSTFYTYGRRIFFIGKYAEDDVKRKFIHYLFLANELGEILNTKCQKHIPLYCMLAQISGILELVFEDIPELGFSTVNGLHKTAKMFQHHLDDEHSYYIFGIFKMQASTDGIHRTACLKQLLRTYIELLKRHKTASNDKSEIISKGKDVIKKLEQTNLDANPRSSAIWSRVGQFQFAIGDTENATVAFRRVCPPCLLAGDVESRFVSKHELTAAYGIADCYNKQEEKKLAKQVLENLLHMLPDVQMQEKRNVQERISSLH